MTEGQSGSAVNARLVLIGIGTFVLAFGLLTIWQAWPLIRWLWDVWDAL